MAFPFLEQLLCLNLVGRLKGGHWVFLALLFHFLKNNQLKHNIPQRHIFEMANSPFPCSHHCLHFIMSRVERQEKVRGPWQGWDLNPAAGLTLNCGEGGFTFSESFFKVMGQTAVTMAGGCTVYRSKIKEGFGRWLLSQCPKERIVSTRLHFEFQDTECFLFQHFWLSLKEQHKPQCKKKKLFFISFNFSKLFQFGAKD